MSEVTRVKQSCGPCRRRKSRCNDQQPCSSCVLRGTEHLCTPAQGAQPSKRPRRIPFAQTPSRSTSPPRRSISEAEPSAKDELARLRSAVNALEAKLEIAAGSSTEIPNSSVVPLSAPTEEERQLWERVEAVLPPPGVIEVLLEFLFQECDWLYYRPNLLSHWLDATSRRGAPTPVAGTLLMSLATSSHLLGGLSQPFYRPGVDPTALASRLFGLAMTLVPASPPTALAELQFLIDIIWHCIYTGQHGYIPSIVGPLLGGVATLGLLDEGLPSWEGVGPAERDERRRVAEYILLTCRWFLLRGERDPLEGQRVNVCRPNSAHSCLTGPIRLPRPPSTPQNQLFEPSLRILRLHSAAEDARTIQSIDLSYEFTLFHPRVFTYLVLLRETAIDSPALIARCEGIHRDMKLWREERMNGTGFALPSLDTIDVTDPIACRNLAQTICAHHAYFHVTAVLLQPLLAAGDTGLDPSSVQKKLHDACLVNAEESLATVPLVRAVVEARSGPLITPWIATNLFNAAMTFAIPVLRAIRRWTPVSYEEEIRRLPAWPEALYEFSHIPVALANETIPSIKNRFPTEIYNDNEVRRCAANILNILDVMTLLKASPLGRSAEKRLRDLIVQTGLGESRSYPPSDEPQPAAGDLPQVNPGGWGVAESDILDQLLQLDENIWHELLAGFVTDDGQPPPLPQDNRD